MAALTRRRRPLLVAIALVAALLAACSDPAPPEPESAPTPTPSSPAPAPTTPSPAPTPVTYAMPLALVVQMTRPVADVPLAEARRVAAGQVTSWSDLHQSGKDVQVVRVGGSTSAADVLAKVRSSTDVVGVLPATEVDATVRVLTVDGHHPLREPKDYPLTVRADQPVPEVTTLSVVGDIMLGRRVGAAMAADDDWTAPFDPLAARLRSSEITVGNFESTLSKNGSPTQGGDSFAADPKALAGLKKAGIDLVSLANNHLGDYGQRAMRETFDRFEGTGIATVGAGRNAAEAALPVVVVRNDLKIGFLAVDSIGETPAATKDRAGTNRLDMPPRTGPLDRAALARISSDITDLAANVDMVVVLTHWGTQYTHEPEASQRTAAKAFAKAGADLVVGGHPHWVQGWELDGTTPVVHSLGNFVFDMDFSTKTREGVFVEATFWGNELKALEPVPYVIGARDFTPRAAHGDRAKQILDDVWSTSRGPYARP